MTIKTKELIRTGLSSELFLLALLKPDSGYELAKRLQNTDKTPSTGKIYPVLKSLTTQKYLKYDSSKKKYFPNLNRLVSDISELLRSKNIFLDEDEIKLLSLMLARREFFSAMFSDVLEQLNNQPKGVHKIDALGVFSNRIGAFAVVFSFARKHHPTVIKKLPPSRESTVEQIIGEFEEMDKDWENSDVFQIDKIMSKDKIFNQYLTQSKLPDDIIKPIFDLFFGLFKSMPSLMVMFSAPQNTLEKLSNLWDQHEGFKIGVDMALKINDKTLQKQNDNSKN